MHGIPKLYMLLLGCRPPGRLTEQHDVFFGIADSLSALVPAIQAFWPEASGKLHIDAWREVTEVDGYAISVQEKNGEEPDSLQPHLFFINLGGYKKGEFEEYHYKLLSVAHTSAEAIKAAKSTTFFRHTGFDGAPSHVDDKYALDVDDLFNVSEILQAVFRERYALVLSRPDKAPPADELHLGYLPLKRI